MKPPTAAQLAALQVATELEHLAAFERPLDVRRKAVEDVIYSAIRALTELWTELPMGSLDSWMTKEQVRRLEERRVPDEEELGRWAAWWRQLAAAIAARDTEAAHG